MKYSIQIYKNKNLFKRHKYPSPNALNIKHFWTLIKTTGGSWVSLNHLILNFKKTSCPKNVWMQHCTQGHASTTVYSEMTSTRKIFLEVLIPKTNIFEKEKLSCYEWEPTKSIPAKAKSATYKNLQTRKKQQQQQAAANENPKN